MGAPSENLSNFVRSYNAIPDEWNDAQEFLVEHLREVSDGINVRDIGYYQEEEVLTGQQFVPSAANPTVLRNVFRKVVDLGGLNDFTATNPQNIAHGITITADTLIPRLYGAATDPSTTFIPLPFVDMSGGGGNIELTMDGTNIVLRSNADYSGFTSAYAVVEYVQEA